MKLVTVSLNKIVHWVGEVEDSKTATQALLQLAHRWASDNEATPLYEPPNKVTVTNESQVIGVFELRVEDGSLN